MSLYSSEGTNELLFFSPKSTSKCTKITLKTSPMILNIWRLWSGKNGTAKVPDLIRVSVSSGLRDSPSWPFNFNLKHEIHFMKPNYNDNLKHHFKALDLPL